jgi:hypothetical protein
MADFLVDFEWFRCPDGYQLVHASETARAMGESPESYPDCEWIVPNSDERAPYRPLERYDALCNVFAAVRTSSELLRFIELFGPLQRTSVGWGDQIPQTLKSAQYFRELLLSTRGGPRKIASAFQHQQWRGLAASYAEVGETLNPNTDVGNLNRLIGSVDLVADRAKGVRIRITTDVFLAALWWQLGQKLSGNTVIRECRHCGALFEAGLGGRRADATFCCSEHSVRFHSLRRSKRV